MDKDLKNKLTRLQELLHDYGEKTTTYRNALIPREPGMVGVAFSGGVDSTLLLRVAADTLGKENVIALHAASCLIPAAARIKAEKLVRGANGIHCSYLTVKIHPLQWREFAINTERRCYFCKKRIYTIFQTKLKTIGRNILLLDGTNADDLRTHRPGLQAIRELSVQIPLAEAHLNKQEVRFLARQMGLENFAQPANSCLATRIPIDRKITRTLLKRVELAEDFLQKKGVSGCRIKPNQKRIVVEVPLADLEKMKEKYLRFEIIEYLGSIGFTDIPLAIRDRGNCD